MKKMGIEALYRKPNLSRHHEAHPIYRYLLRGVEIDGPNQVWAADITYFPMRRGFVYLIAVIDWYSRKVLCWRLSNTMTTDFCLDAVRDAIQTRFKLKFVSRKIGVGSVWALRPAASETRFCQRHRRARTESQSAWMAKGAGKTKSLYFSSLSCELFKSNDIFALIASNSARRFLFKF